MIEKAAKFDSFIRPLVMQKLPKFGIELYSKFRKEFLKHLVASSPADKVYLSESNAVQIWDLRFNCSLFNSAGMFKSGYGYELCYRQGAGAFLAGTSTGKPRPGNQKDGLWHPFMPMPKSNAALNWLGLPNDGHTALAQKLSKIEKKIGCPIGASLSSDPDLTQNEALPLLVDGIKDFARAGVDFIEINESCPNVAHNLSDEKINGLDKALVERLEFISDKFLKFRNNNLPIIVKFSVETDIDLVENIMTTLIDLGYDGVNFGNTVKKYDQYLNKIDNADIDNLKYFTDKYGGGLSGKPLKNDSLLLASKAVKIRNSKNCSREFAVIRTGGIDSRQDIIDSQKNGVDLNQWFTGYFEMFSKYGHELYKELFDTL